MRDLIAEMGEESQELPVGQRIERQGELSRIFVQPWEQITPLTDAEIDAFALCLWGEDPAGRVNRRVAFAVLTANWSVMPNGRGREVLRDWILELR